MKIITLSTILILFFSGCTIKSATKFIDNDYPIIYIPKEINEINITTDDNGNLIGINAVKAINGLSMLRWRSDVLEDLIKKYNKFASNHNAKNAEKTEEDDSFWFFN